IENFALLCDAELAGETVDGLGEDGAVGGASATAYGASAAMEEAEVDAALVRNLVESAVRFPYLPGAGNHAAILVGVGVAEHDFLLISPGFEQRLVGVGCPKGAHDSGAIAQVFNGLEKRDGLKAGVAVVGVGGVDVAFDTDTAQAGEAKDVEDIFGGGSSADDVAGERLGDIVALELGDCAEGVEDL